MLTHVPISSLWFCLLLDGGFFKSKKPNLELQSSTGYWMVFGPVAGSFIQNVTRTSSGGLAFATSDQFLPKRPGETTNALTLAEKVLSRFRGWSFSDRGVVEWKPPKGAIRERKLWLLRCKRAERGSSLARSSHTPRAWLLAKLARDSFCSGQSRAWSRGS